MVMVLKRLVYGLKVVLFLARMLPLNLTIRRIFTLFLFSMIRLFHLH
ncbi:hypothetical protein E2C01_019127 [Portunus trituberculatus]|uniref:Uncharacterized protein n=1 Tax=Portunus trituberculatus TaxID=210409 RepID=A0A5B7DWU2_PORTR|nr:hypothetical protein [Portunus trituberculatus]